MVDDVILTSVVVLIQRLEPADVVVRVSNEMNVEHAGLRLRAGLTRRKKEFHELLDEPLERIE
jgi:hypothetical protein